MQQELSLKHAREQARLSLRAAAKALEISPGHLSGLESGKRTFTPGSPLAQKMAAVYGVPATVHLEQPLPTAEHEFVPWLREQLKWWDPRFTVRTAPAPPRLVTDLYIEQILSITGRSIPQEQLLSEYLHKPGRFEGHGLRLSGGPGSGKSFFLRYLTLTVDELCQRWKIPAYLPVLVSLGDYLRPARLASVATLATSLAEYYGRQGFEGSLLRLETLFRETLQTGRLLLLMDGLDEIYEPTQRLAMWVYLEETFRAIRGPGNKMIVSGRKPAFTQTVPPEATLFHLVEIDRWTPAQMYRGCHQWFARERERERANQCWFRMTAHADLVRLAQIPLLLHVVLLQQHALEDRPLADLLDACCQVFEETWTLARLIFPPRFVAADTVRPGLEIPGWVRWRHFLVRLMESQLQQAHPQLTFSETEMGLAWQDFLAFKGVKQGTLEFSQLQDAPARLNRLGPLIRQPADTAQKVFVFLDPLFGDYYLARALRNQSAQWRHDFVLEHFREPAWQTVIPLMLQELGRSDHPAEPKEGERLLQILTQVEDAVTPSMTAGLFTAMKALPPYNLSQEWAATILQRYVDLCMQSHYEKDLSIAFEVLGEYSTSKPLRQLWEQAAEALSRGPVDDTAWRYRAGQLKLGEPPHAIIEAISTQMRQLLARMIAQPATVAEYGVTLRRLCWSFRLVGTLLVATDSEARESSEVSADHRQHLSNALDIKAASIAAIQEDMNRVVQAAVDAMQYDFPRRKAPAQKSSYSPQHFWDILSVVIQSQHQLRYHEELSKTIQAVYHLILRPTHARYFRQTYPYSQQFLQFLKVTAYYVATLPCEARAPLALDTLRERLEAWDKTLHKIDPDTGWRRDLAVLLSTLSTWGEPLPSQAQAGSPNQQEPNPEQSDDARAARRCADFYGPYTAERFQAWRAVIRTYAQGQGHPDVLSLGHAVCAVKTFYEQLDAADCYTLAEELSRALQQEEAISDTTEKERNRVFTRPFSDYTFPLYDSLYTCLATVRQSLPLSRGEASRKTEGV